MSLFICPVCNEKLNLNGRTYGCKNGHFYDLARQGYVNLLQPNKRHSDDPGDSREMVLARRELLESGLYSDFSDKLNNIVLGLSADRQNLSILDCGCGEGYYDGRLISFLKEKGKGCELYGFDISKNAVKYGAGKYKTCNFAVGSCFEMPVSDNSFDIGINIFAPMVSCELSRKIKSGGFLIYAVPTDRHLMGLKQAIYENTYENRQKNTEYEGFDFVERVRCQKEISVEGEMLINLFKMTPYYYKSEKNAVDKLLDKGKIKTEIGFDFLIYKRN